MHGCSVQACKLFCEGFHCNLARQAMVQVRLERYATGSVKRKSLVSYRMFVNRQATLMAFWANIGRMRVQKTLVTLNDVQWLREVQEKNRCINKRIRQLRRDMHRVHEWQHCKQQKMTRYFNLRPVANNN